MGEHIDNRKSGKKQKKKTYEGADELARRRRVSFKSYLREQEEELLEADLDEADDDYEDVNAE